MDRRNGEVAVIFAVSVDATAVLIDGPVANWVHEHLDDERLGWFAASYAGHSLRLGPFIF